ncbi:DNA mismatch repair protein MutS [Aurantibacillus circumpalustris]|uniref:DNA mismatch repair protein MutS n=1 Tax=Aurantibacillus circumpalustris TaxID=3036359 RepID=UPI00295B3DE0|nr:DNA mismatch repair protein MutS [Aurantibacillus circumpalustris]
MSKTKEVKETPLMKQYNTIKAKYPDAILLFRVGDFYETFGEDAIKASKILGITLTKRANGSASHIELAGFPHHSIDSYLPKLVRAGYRVAICDQLEDPKMVKGIVKRGITELVTPGVSYNDKILNHQQNNFLASIHFENKEAGLALCDVSTGEFLVTQGSLDYIEKLLQNFKPNELLFEKSKRNELTELVGDRFYSFGLDDWSFTYDYGYESLTKQFDTISLKGFGIEDQHTAIKACGAILHYLSETKHDKLKHINRVSRIEEDNYVWLDKFTIRNLELYNSNHENGKSLIDVIDKTVSPMGSRLLKRWLALPLKNSTAINERLNAVEYFVKEQDQREELISALKEVGDLERLISKVAAFKVNPRELVHLKKSLQVISEIKEKIKASSNPTLQKIADQLNPCQIMFERLDNELNEEAPVSVLKGNAIAKGVNAELDELRNIAFNGKDYLLQIQQREVEKTGITSLKVAFNSVFGYYLEVTHIHKDKVPQEWIRKQTLTTAERYITPELKVYEEKILGAEEKITAIEHQLFENLVRDLADYIPPIQLNANLLARLDVFCGFAILANENQYNRPQFDEGFAIDITDGRHPVIEKQLGVGIEYVSNSVYLDNENTQIMMITGPNMSGKSALLRQTALIVLLAQIGSYVPAKAANLSIIDKIFTRVGATDNISSGESTFMVEMNETASILNNLSDRSLVLLDEIGRGTSTYDGISIAWSIAEFMHNQPVNRAKTLFATHYHELNDMTNLFPRIKNFNVSVKESGNKIIFLRKLAEGGSEHSFGIHVARMAGMPNYVIERANVILKKLEKEHEFELEGTDSLVINGTAKIPSKDKSELQLSFFQLNDPILQQIKEDVLEIDINTLTPVEALLKLSEIKKLVGG